MTMKRKSKPPAGEAVPDGRQYVDGGTLPKSVAPGRILAHNHIMHTTTTHSGVRGFRVWT